MATTTAAAAAAAGSEVGGGLGGQGLDAAGVTVFAEHVSVQRVAALVVPLRQQRATVLRDTSALSAFSTTSTHTHRLSLGSQPTSNIDRCSQPCQCWPNITHTSHTHIFSKGPSTCFLGLLFLWTAAARLLQPFGGFSFGPESFSPQTLPLTWEFQALLRPVFCFWPPG